MVDKWHGPSDCIISPPKSNNDKHIKPNENYKINFPSISANGYLNKQQATLPSLSSPNLE